MKNIDQSEAWNYIDIAGRSINRDYQNDTVSLVSVQNVINFLLGHITAGDLNIRRITVSKGTFNQLAEQREQKTDISGLYIRGHDVIAGPDADWWERYNALVDIVKYIVDRSPDTREYIKLNSFIQAVLSRK